MDQRLPVLLLLFTLQTANAIEIEPPVIVEAAPLETFNDRATGWNFSEEKAEDVHLDARESYETLGQIPGLASANETQRLSIRGSSSLARILGLYDGVPINTPDGFGFSSLLVPNENLGSVRIIRGPASIFWGKDAMGGAINYLPKKLERAAIRAHVGSFMRKGLFLGAPLMKPSSTGYLQFTAFNESLTGNFPYESTTSSLSGERSPNDRALQRFTLNASQKFENLSLGENVVWAQDFNSTPGSIYFPEHNRGNRKAGMASINTAYTIDSNLSFNYRIFGILNDNAYETTSPSVPVMATSNSKTLRVGNSLSVRKIFSGEIEMEFFADHFHDEFESSYIQSDKLKSDEGEIGAIANISFQSNWVIKPGLRYSASHNKVIPALGLFEEFGSFSRWLTYSHGFRVPDLSMKFANTPYFVGNPDLKTETSEQVELGFKQKNQFETKWNFIEYGVTVFTTAYKDLLVYESTVTPNTYSNTGRANVQGVEGFAGYFQDIWGIEGEIAYTKSEDGLKQPLSFAPEVQGLLKEHYTWAVLKFELEHSVWSRYYEGATERTGFITTDFHVKTYALNDWEAKASVFNIFNSPREIIRGFPEAQRKFHLSVERSF